MQSVHRALYEISPHCMLLGIAEADFRRSDLEEKYDFTYYGKSWAVFRRRLLNGRAMKIFVAKELEDCFG